MTANTVTFHASEKNGNFVGWTEFSAGYEGPDVTITYLPPPISASGRERLDALRAGTAPDGADHVHIAAAASEHAVLIPAEADVVVIGNCGGGSGPS